MILGYGKKRIIRKGTRLEYQEGYTGYDDDGHLMRPEGKVVKVLDQNKGIVLVKSEEDGIITKHQIGNTILFI